MSAFRSLVLLLCLTLPLSSAGADLISSLPPPEVNAESWVMIEIWPEVRDITLSAYFLDFSGARNRNLCEATKAVFDRDQDGRSRTKGRKGSSYRLCLSVADAVAKGLIRR
jgi:hypothetical protein